MNLGILGGTFNPIHLAHLRLAEEMLESLGLERALFIPAAIPPLKHSGVAAAEHRLEVLGIPAADQRGTRSCARQCWRRRQGQWQKRQWRQGQWHGR